MNDSTVVLKGTGPGIKITLPKTGKVTIASKGKLSEINLTPKTILKLVA